MADPKSALTNLKKAYKLAPNEPAVMDNMAMILLQYDKYNEAKLLWEKILKKGRDGLKDNPIRSKVSKAIVVDSFYFLALCYEGLKNYKKANYYIKKHLAKRKRGISSYWYKKTILNKLKEFQNK